MKRKTHLPETRKDTGPAEPRTFCGQTLMAVDLVPFDEKPTCAVCRAAQKKLLGR